MLKKKRKKIKNACFYLFIGSELKLFHLNE